MSDQTYQDHFKKMIEIQAQEDLDKYGITLFNELSRKDEVKNNEAIYRKIGKQKINKIFIGNPTRNRKENSIYITDISILNWHELQMLNIRGADALAKMVNLYNIFGYVLNYEMIFENSFGTTIIQRGKNNYDYSSYILSFRS